MSPFGSGQDPAGAGAFALITVLPAGVLELLQAATSTPAVTARAPPRQARAVIRVPVGVMARYSQRKKRLARKPNTTA
jgi:hypothetical protein